MKKIPLTQGKFALVDDGDYEELSKYQWYAIAHRATFYAVRAIYTAGVPRKNRQKRVWMHRTIMRPKNGMQTDHKDGDGLNNQRSNLRVCHQSQNMANRKMMRSNTSGYRGVTKPKVGRGWVARVGINGDRLFVGYFPDAETAAHAYDEAARKYHGEFARPNFPQPKEAL